MGKTHRDNEPKRFPEGGVKSKRWVEIKVESARPVKIIIVVVVVEWCCILIIYYCWQASRASRSSRLRETLTFNKILQTAAEGCLPPIPSPFVVGSGFAFKT